MLATSLEVATIAEMAARLSLSEGTVRNHLSAAIQKVGARNRAEAARIAEEKGWLAPPTSTADVAPATSAGRAGFRDAAVIRCRRSGAPTASVGETRPSRTHRTTDHEPEDPLS